MPLRTIRPFVGAPGTTPFYIPPTIQSDFENYLDTDVPNVNFTWEIVTDWPKRSTAGYEPVYLRAEMYPINWKSNFANADNTANFKTDLRVPVIKGDIAIREDGQIRQLNWKVEKHINDQHTQAQECNLMLTVTRRVDDEVDPTTGMLIAEAHDKEIVSQHPCAAYQYDGRPYYDTGFNSPGIAPDALTMIQIQWNSATKQLRVADEFDWFVDRYRIINLDYSGIDVDQKHGVLKIHARKIAGSSEAIV